MKSDTILKKTRELKLFSEYAEVIKESVLPTENTNIPYVGLEHIEQNTLRLSSIGKSSDVISQKFKFKKGDILFGKLRPYFRKVIRPHFDGICSTDIFVVRAKEGISQTFLYYLMASQKFVNYSSQGTEGTRMPRAAWDFLEKYEQQIPSFDNQEKIGKILADIDIKIETLRNENKILEQIIQSIFKSWFVDFDGVKEFEDSELGLIPKRWEVNQLDNIAVFLNGLPMQKFRPINDSFLPVIKIREMKNGISTNTEKARIDIEQKFIVNNGDILFSWSGTLELIIWTLEKGALNQHIFKVTSKKYKKWFLFMWIKFHLNEFRRIAEGKVTTMGHIQRHHLSEASVLIPNKEILKKMNKIMDPIFEKYIQNQNSIQNLSKTRDILLPKLMSGEIKV